MIGGDLPASQPETIALFTNADVLRVHRESVGSREVFREGDTVVWAADGPDGIRYAAVFNLSDTARDLVLDAGDLGLAGAERLTELWSGRELVPEPVAQQSNAARGVAPGSTALRLALPAHGAALLRT
jgi:hypothetical protein